MEQDQALVDIMKKSKQSDSLCIIKVLEAIERLVPSNEASGDLQLLSQHVEQTIGDTSSIFNLDTLKSVAAGLDFDSRTLPLCYLE